MYSALCTLSVFASIFAILSIGALSLRSESITYVDTHLTTIGKPSTFPCELLSDSLQNCNLSGFGQSAGEKKYISNKQAQKIFSKHPPVRIMHPQTRLFPVFKLPLEQCFPTLVLKVHGP